MRKINKIILHCSATRPSQDIGKEEINAWHLAQGWSGIGYHFVIRRDGALEHGRDISETGAHCFNHNKGSIGICLIGGVTENDIAIAENNFTEEQFAELERLVKMLLADYASSSQEIKVHGHNDFANKGCPCFDVEEFCFARGILKA